MTRVESSGSPGRSRSGTPTPRWASASSTGSKWALSCTRSTTKAAATWSAVSVRSPFFVLPLTAQGSDLRGAYALRPVPSTATILVYAANRLGIPDANFRQSYGAGSEQNRTHYTFYGVASAFLKGFQSDIFPDHDFTFTLGWGDGLFHDGESLRWYSFASAKGFFPGALPYTWR